MVLSPILHSTLYLPPLPLKKKKPLTCVKSSIDCFISIVVYTATHNLAPMVDSHCDTHNLAPMVDSHCDTHNLAPMVDSHCDTHNLAPMVDSHCDTHNLAPMVDSHFVTCILTGMPPPRVPLPSSLHDPTHFAMPLHLAPCISCRLMEARMVINP